MPAKMSGSRSLSAPPSHDEKLHECSTGKLDPGQKEANFPLNRGSGEPRSRKVAHKRSIDRICDPVEARHREPSKPPCARQGTNLVPGILPSGRRGATGPRAASVWRPALSVRAASAHPCAHRYGPKGVQSIGTLARCAAASVGLTLACATFLAADRMSKPWIFDLALGDFTWSGRQCDQRHVCASGRTSTPHLK